MVITKLMGGLGNQMFQYAAARAIAFRLNAKLKLDISQYSKSLNRKYSLAPFNIKAEIATPEEVALFSGIIGNRIDRLLFLFRSKTKLKNWTVICESRVGDFNPKVVGINGNVFLSGYWQNETYFNEIRETLCEEFALKSQGLDGYNQNIINSIEKNQSISIHVRRGDFVSDPKTRNFHGICEPSYYQSCIKLIEKQVPNPSFFVFSDDILWTKNNIHFDHPVTYVHQKSKKKDYLDLFLMSHCKHHIIANSSFSWWGAWLNFSHEKLVYSPKKWFTEPRMQSLHIAPKEWIRV